MTVARDIVASAFQIQFHFLTGLCNINIMSVSHHSVSPVTISVHHRSLLTPSSVHQSSLTPALCDPEVEGKKLACLHDLAVVGCRLADRMPDASLTGGREPAARLAGAGEPGR